MNEDVFPIEHGDFPASHVGFQGCKKPILSSYFASWVFQWVFLVILAALLATSAISCPALTLMTQPVPNISASFVSIYDALRKNYFWGIHIVNSRKLKLTKLMLYPYGKLYNLKD